MKETFKTVFANDVSITLSALEEIDKPVMKEAIAELITAGNPDISISLARQAAAALIVAVENFWPDDIKD